MFSLRKMQSFLSKQIAFSPNKAGTMKPIVDTNNPEYFMDRAKEAIETAKIEKRSRYLHLIVAIKLLTLAALHYEPKKTESDEGT